MKRLLSIAILVVCASVSMGQALTLDQCRKLALQNQADIRGARLDVEVAKQARDAAFTKYFPQLSLSAFAFRSQNYLLDYEASSNSDNVLDVNVTFDGQDLNSRIATIQGYIDLAGYDVNLQQLIDDFASRFNVDAHLQMLDRGYFGGALAVWPIFAGGRIINGNRLAKLGVDAAELQLQMSENEVLANVEQNYWLVASLLEKKKTLIEAITLVDTLRRDAESAVTAGVIGRNDLLKVKLKSDELTANRTTLDNAIALATMALCQYIGIGYNDSIILVDSLGAGLPQLPVANFDISQRPENGLLDISSKAARLQRLMTVGEALPQLAIGGTYGVGDLLGDKPRANGIVFATLSVPLTALWESSYNAGKMRLEQQKTELKNEDMRQKMGLQMQRAWNELTEAYALISVKRQAVSDAEENMTEVANYYEAGMATLSEYLEAQSMLRQTRNDLADQLITYRLKHLAYSLMH